MMNGRMAIITLAAATVMAVGCETPHRQPPPRRVQYPSQPLSLADVKMLAKSGVSDEVILSQIRNSHTVYHLSAAEILDLKDAGLSEKVIDFMINTPTLYRSPRPPPPPPSY
jgi:citrate lyase beta subunit